MNVLQVEGGVPIKAWTDGVPFEESAAEQLRKIAKLPFIYNHIAVMPDVHMGIGATIGSVIPTRGAIVPAAVGVDIGCGMMAVKTSLVANDLPDNLHELRRSIETSVPCGRTDNGGPNDSGAWKDLPAQTLLSWRALQDDYASICEKHPAIAHRAATNQLGTLGTGNHFIEVCLDQNDSVWFMLHSGSRGVGNRIGTYFISLAREQCERWFVPLPDKDLAYLPEGTPYFDDYRQAVAWAQQYALTNRELMMNQVIIALEHTSVLPRFDTALEVVQCHHNFVAKEHHFGKDVYVTRKGAVRAKYGDLGIIPGSMGAKSFIVRGKGNVDSFHSCSHGAGRAMGRREAKRTFSLADHKAATAGIECRKDVNVLDETPGAYKSIDAVMAAQSDLVEIVYTLRQVLCVKG